MTRIFSGIQSRGAKHLGNYSSTLGRYERLQREAEVYACIVDLHSITVDDPPDQRRRSLLELAAALFAAGLDPGQATVFAQSHVGLHAEAAWLLSPFMGYGQLLRMRQYQREARRVSAVSAAMFTWPMLMVADILLYRPDLVASGTDNRQQLELTRAVAKRFNARYGETFTVPRELLPEAGARIMNLQEPWNKMTSWEGPAKGVILLADPPDVIRAKVRSARVDSGHDIGYDPQDRPGIANLLEILATSTGETVAVLADRHRGLGYAAFKECVAEALIAWLEPFRTRYEALRADPAELMRLLRAGAEKAREQAEGVLAQTYERMGFARLAAG